MKHNAYFLYLAAFVLMAGCKVQKKNDAAAASAVTKTKTVAPAPVKSVEITRELRLDDVYVELVGQNQPDLYDVNFSWPQTRDRVRLTVNGQELAVMDTRETLEYKLENVQGGRKLSVLVSILDQQNHIIISETRDLEVPKDYIFPKKFTLSNNMTIQNERVFMSRSTVTTLNYNLTIKTKKLIILEKSLVQNFEENQKAAPVSHGRNGGEIRIEAETAEGDLEVTLNSEIGGDGFKGMPSKSCPASIAIDYCHFQFNCPQGGSGWDAGKNGSLFVKINKKDNFTLYHQSTISEGGRPGPADGADTVGDYPTYNKSFGIKSPLLQCPQKPVAGLPAQEGKVCFNYPGQASEAGCE